MSYGVSAVLQTTSWHDGGLFMGMHWLWWCVWVLTLAFLGWAFVRLAADRSDTSRRLAKQEAAEEALRKRFAEGEIGEEEYVRNMKILRDTIQGA